MSIIYLGFEDKLPSGKYRWKSVQEVTDELGKEGLKELIREGHHLSDEVLNKFKIHRIKRDNKTVFEVVAPNSKTKDTLICKKETLPIEKVLDLLNKELNNEDDAYTPTIEDQDLSEASSSEFED